ncbi:flavin oxidoreductase [Thioclava sp. SK-1]|nr:flavin oxidoreductase [Thioclava sp. SK-1]
MESGHSADVTDPKALRSALGRFATGVTVVTATQADGTPVGITANSFASVSLDPPLVLWSAARSSMRHAHFTAAPAFSVHILGADQTDLAMHFTKNGSRFDGLDYQLNAEGVPILAGAIARFECATDVMHEGGDHTIIIGRVLRFTATTGAPMLFCDGAFGQFTKGP